MSRNEKKVQDTPDIFASTGIVYVLYDPVVGQNGPEASSSNAGKGFIFFQFYTGHYTKNIPIFATNWDFGPSFYRDNPQSPKRMHALLSNKPLFELTIILLYWQSKIILLHISIL